MDLCERVQKIFDSCKTVEHEKIALRYYHLALAEWIRQRGDIYKFTPIPLHLRKEEYE